MARHHRCGPDPHRASPPTRPPIRPRMEINGWPSLLQAGCAAQETQDRRRIRKPRRFQFGRQPSISCAFGTQLLRSWATQREALSLIHWLRDQDKPQSEWLDAIAADQNLTEFRRGGPTCPRMEMTAHYQVRDRAGSSRFVDFQVRLAIFRVEFGGVEDTSSVVLDHVRQFYRDVRRRGRKHIVKPLRSTGPFERGQDFANAGIVLMRSRDVGRLRDETSNAVTKVTNRVWIVTSDAAWMASFLRLSTAMPGSQARMSVTTSPSTSVSR